MDLSRIVISETSDQQIIVLKERNGQRAFPIVIGIFEASAIDRAVKEIPTERPLTHDLLRRVIEALNGDLVRIVVNDLRDNTFFAKLVIQRDGKQIEVDSRPSDAIALAAQKNTPIFVEERVLDQVCPAETGDQT
jgi:bifunctional DNase/RNase